MSFPPTPPCNGWVPRPRSNESCATQVSLLRKHGRAVVLPRSPDWARDRLTRSDVRLYRSKCPRLHLRRTEAIARGCGGACSRPPAVPPLGGTNRGLTDSNGRVPRPRSRESCASRVIAFQGGARVVCPSKVFRLGARSASRNQPQDSIDPGATEVGLWF